MTYLIKPQIKSYTKNLWWNRFPKAIKNRYESLNTETLRCKRNNISNVLKDVFCYNSFLLNIQLMKVLSQEIKTFCCNKTKKAENCLNNIFYFWIIRWDNHWTYSPFRLTSLIYAEKLGFANPVIMEDKQCKQKEWYSLQWQRKAIIFCR